MLCPICQTEGREIFKNTILKKYDVSYFQCRECKLIYTETPFWLEEAYQDAIVGTDTGLMQRNISFCVTVNTLIRKFYPSSKNFLDYGAGYGIFVRLMRDVGHHFQWMDKYSENLVAKGFEYQDGSIDFVTAFELFEHFDKPLQEFEHLLSYSKNILIIFLVVALCLLGTGCLTNISDKTYTSHGMTITMPDGFYEKSLAFFEKKLY